MVVRYKTRRPADVTVSYKAKLKNGKSLALGEVVHRFKREGIFRLPKKAPGQIEKLRTGVKSFVVKFAIPGTERRLRPLLHQTADQETHRAATVRLVPAGLDDLTWSQARTSAPRSSRRTPCSN